MYLARVTTHWFLLLHWQYNENSGRPRCLKNSQPRGHMFQHTHTLIINQTPSNPPNGTIGKQSRTTYPPITQQGTKSLYIVSPLLYPSLLATRPRPVRSTAQHEVQSERLKADLENGLPDRRSFPVFFNSNRNLSCNTKHLTEKPETAQAPSFPNLKPLDRSYPSAKINTRPSTST